MLSIFLILLVSEPAFEYGSKTNQEGKGVKATPRENLFVQARLGLESSTPNLKGLSEYGSGAQLAERPTCTCLKLMLGT